MIFGWQGSVQSNNVHKNSSKETSKETQLFRRFFQFHTCHEPSKKFTKSAMTAIEQQQQPTSHQVKLFQSKEKCVINQARGETFNEYLLKLDFI
jgi:hypothetical protein